MKPSDIFFDLVKTTFAPALREAGFRGSGRTFRRVHDECVHIVNIQTSMSGGQCAVNLAVAFTFCDGVDAATVKEDECDIRRRLSPTAEGTDYWWKFGDGAQITQESVVSLIDAYKLNGEQFFRRFGQLPGDYAHISIDDIRTPARYKLPGGTTGGRYALVLAQIWLHLQRREKAMDFVRFGIETSGPAAVGLRSRLKEIEKRIEQSAGGDGSPAAGSPTPRP